MSRSELLHRCLREINNLKVGILEHQSETAQFGALVMMEAAPDISVHSSSVYRLQLYIEKTTENALQKYLSYSEFFGRNFSDQEHEIAEFVMQARVAPEGKEYIKNIPWVNLKYPLFCVSPDMVLVDSLSKKPEKIIEIKCCSREWLFGTENMWQFQLMLFVFDL